MRYILVLAFFGLVFFKRKSRRKALVNPVEVFTPEFVARLPALNKFSNPTVVRLCRDPLPSNIQIRNSIELWYQRLDRSDKPGMLARLRDTDDVQHLAAFFELAFQNYFENENTKVVKDPVLEDETTPDFRLSIDQAEVFVEVRTIMVDAAARIAQKSMHSALIQLDKISTKYALAVHFEADPATNQTIPKQLKNVVSEWLSTLEVAEGKRVQKIFEKGGFQIELTASNIGLSEGPGKVWYWSDPVKFLGRSLPLMKRGIKEKAAKYKDLQRDGKPYVVALCSTDPNFILEDIWMKVAAYGTLESRPADGGVFVLSTEQEKKRGLSGLLHFMLIQNSESFALHANYYPNPAATAPVPEIFGWRAPDEIRANSNGN